MKKLVALLAIAALAGTTHAQTITFDLSGTNYEAGAPVVLTLPGAAGTVTNVQYSFGVTGQNGSWTSEVSIELSSPSGTLPAPLTTNGLNPGLIAATPSDAGTIVWTTAPGPSWNMSPSPDINLGWLNTAAAQSASGASAKLNGLSSDGTWTLRIFDSYNDAGNDGVFAANSSITISYTAGGGHDFTFNTAQADFGNVTVGTTSGAQTVTLTNIGSDEGSEVLSFSGAPFAIVGGSCPSGTVTLAAGASCTVEVAFSPTVTGAANGTLSVANNPVRGTTATVALIGNGTEPAGSADFSFNVSSLSFGNVNVGGTSAPQSVTLSNTGNAAGQISGFNIAAPFSISGGTCGAAPTLAVGGSCTLSVVFSPTAPGAAAGTLSFSIGGKGTFGSITTVSLGGTGVAGGAPSVALPVNSPWALAALLGLVALVAGTRLRRRRC